MHKHFLIKAAGGQSPLLLETYLSNHIRHYNPELVLQYLSEQRILVNDTPVTVGYRVCPGDEIFVLQPYSNYRKEPKPQAIALEILYEDENLIVVNKPAGMAIHPGLGTYEGTLLNALLHHLDGQKPFFVHRLDKHTSGPLVIAKDQETATMLKNCFALQKPLRIYEALAWGTFGQTSGTVDIPIGRNPDKPESIEASPKHLFGKPAITHFKIKKTFKQATWLELKLTTGRTHQIRVHLQYMGHSVINDTRYPCEHSFHECSLEMGSLSPHHMLSSTLLGFEHPHKHIMLEFKVEPPANFKEALKLLEKQSQSGEKNESISF